MIVPEDVLRCSSCGSSLIAGWCLTCETRRWSRFVHRELILLAVLVGIAVAAFFGTRAVAHSNDDLRRREAATWFDAAERASGSGNPQTAIAGLRRAVSKDPENKKYRLALAGALSAHHLDAEATRLLLALREMQPEDPETNLQLARLQSHSSDADVTRRYYQNALAGLWRPEQGEQRRRVRMELIQFLLAHGAPARALSELLVLAASLPDDAAVQTQVGRMFLAAGDPRLALDHFEWALRENSENADALTGAGEAAFELADYSRALRYLNSAPRENARVAELREVSRLVLNRDPLAPRLPAGERAKRLSAAWQQAVRRLEACLGDRSMPSNGSLETLRNEARTLQASLGARRREARDLVDDGVDLVYRIERAVELHCAIPPTPLDRALLLIGRRHGFEEP
jgi:tetratricopeptide (TPR) repeat protein